MHATHEELSNVAATLELVELEQLVREQSRRLNNFIRRRISNPEDVEDIAQDTLLEALKFRERYQGDSRPETWLFGIALNLIRTHYKRQRVRQIFDDIEVAESMTDDGRGPAEVVEARQQMERVSRAFSVLPNETRQVVHLVFDAQLTYEETASHLGIPVGTVRSRISRARTQLRQLQLD